MNPTLSQADFIEISPPSGSSRWGDALRPGLRFRSIRLTALVGIASLLALVVSGTVTYFSLEHVANAFKNVVERTNPLRDDVSSMEIELHQTVGMVGGYLHLPLPEARRTIEKDLVKLLGPTDRSRKLAITQEQAAALDNIERSLKPFAASAKTVLELRDDHALRAGDIRVAIEKLDRSLDRVEVRARSLPQSAGGDSAQRALAHLRRQIAKIASQYGRPGDYFSAAYQDWKGIEASGLAAFQDAAASLGKDDVDLGIAANIWRELLAEAHALDEVSQQIDENFTDFINHRRHAERLIRGFIQALSATAVSSVEKETLDALVQSERTLIASVIVVVGMLLAMWLTLSWRTARSLAAIESVAADIKSGKSPALDAPAGRYRSDSDELRHIETLLRELGREVAVQRQTLNRQNLSLEDQVRIKTEALSGAVEVLRGELDRRNVLERQLAEERNAATQANQAKTLFLANMSHELRTPLNAIIGFSEAMHTELYGKINEPKYREYAEFINRSGNHLLAIISDVLDTARLEIGHVSVAAAPTDAREIIADCVRICAGRASEARVTLVTEHDGGPYMLETDGTRFRQILLNITINAIKFSPRDSKVRITLVSQPDEIVVTAADDGIGMSADEIKIAMQPFSQVHEGLSRRWDGLGLGLTIANKLCAVLGGSLTITSRKGIGTNAIVRLPRTNGQVGNGAGATSGRNARMSRLSADTRVATT